MATSRSSASRRTSSASVWRTLMPVSSLPSSVATTGRVIVLLDRLARARGASRPGNRPGRWRRCSPGPGRPGRRPRRWRGTSGRSCSLRRKIASPRAGSPVLGDLGEESAISLGRRGCAWPPPARRPSSERLDQRLGVRPEARTARMPSLATSAGKRLAGRAPWPARRARPCARGTRRQTAAAGRLVRSRRPASCGRGRAAAFRSSAASAATASAWTAGRCARARRVARAPRGSPGRRARPGRRWPPGGSGVDVSSACASSTSLRPERLRPSRARRPAPRRRAAASSWPSSSAPSRVEVAGRA